MENNTGQEHQPTDEQLRLVFRELNYFPEGYEDSYQPPSLEDDFTPKHAYHLVDEIYWGADEISQIKIRELLRNIALSNDAALLAEIICRYAFVNYDQTEKAFADFLKEGRSYESIH